jgi:hypothetical protein
MQLFFVADVGCGVSGQHVSQGLLDQFFLLFRQVARATG